MKEDRVTVTETIQFFPDGSSRHTWDLPDGTRLAERSFDKAPVVFLASDGFKTGPELGIAVIERKST